MTSPHEHLDAALDARRVELHMSWRDLTNTAGISYEALRAIRRGGRTPSLVTKRRVEDALQWAPGSIDAILDGGDPTPLDVPERPAPTADDDLDAQLAEAQELLARASELLAQINDQREAGGGRA